MKILEKHRLRATFLRELARDLQQEHVRSQYLRAAAGFGDAENGHTPQHGNPDETRVHIGMKS